VTRVAAIDCGTNSIRLLVADIVAEHATLRDVDRRMEIVRLGQGVDRTGRLAPDAIQRTLAACRRYARIIRDTGAEQIRFVATSATRDVENRADFVAGVRDALGVEPEVITGDEEAALSFAGATRELLAAGVEQPVLVVDIGGGSTEFVLGDRGGADVGNSQDGSQGGSAGRTTVRAARSVDIGCVRMTERHLHSDPPTEDEITAARADIDASIALAAETVALARTGTLVGLAGSVTTVAAMALDLPSYLPERIHHARIPAADVHRVARRLLSMSHAERAALPFMHPGRVDVIGAGALVLAAVLDRVPVDEVVVSEHDILDGIAWSIVERTDRKR
jgi:exopolyphosphatase/guanosine-5'-triphosphate,3'-diphosphate pyrophosphatase